MIGKSMVSDESLIRQVLDGRRESFDVLVKRYLRVVHAVAYARTRSHADAEDITQEAFVKAFTSLHTLRDPGRFGAWLATIARRICYGLTQGARRRGEVEEAAGSEEHFEPVDVEQRELVEMVRRQLDRLDEDQREILMLRYYAGHSVREVAAILEITPDAAAKRLQRAREALGEQLLDVLGRSSKDDAATSRRLIKISGAIAMTSAPWQVPGTTAAASAKMLATGNASKLAGGFAVVKTKALVVAGVVVLLAGVGGYLHTRDKDGPQSGAAVQGTSTQDDVHHDELALSTTGDSETVASTDIDGAETRVSDALNSVMAAEPVTSGARARHNPAPAKILDPAQYARIDGRVIDEDEEPVPDATVTLVVIGAGPNSAIRPSPGGGPLHALKQALTDKPGRFATTSGADGAFSLKDIPYEGLAIVRTEAEGFCPENVSVVLGKSSEETVVVLSRGVPVEGRVLSSGGLPVDDARVRVTALSWFEAGAGGGSMGGSGPRDGVHTDGQGCFTLTIRRHGFLTIKVDSPSHGRATFGNVLSKAGERLELDMPAVATVRGRVTWADGSPALGCVVTLQGSFVQGIEVEMPDGMRFGAAGGGGSLLDDRFETTVDASGAFRIEGVDPGLQYVVSITDPDGAPVAGGLELGEVEAGRERVWNHRITEGRPS